MLPSLGGLFATGHTAPVSEGRPLGGLPAGSLARERGRREGRGKLFGPSRLQFLTGIGATRTYLAQRPQPGITACFRAWLGPFWGRRPFFMPPAARQRAACNAFSVDRCE